MRPLLALALASIATTLPLAAVAATGVPCRFYAMNPGAPVWGGTVILDAAYAKQMAARGAHAVRIDFRLDQHASWNAAALAQYDGIVDAAIGAGLEPLGLMAYEAVPGGQAAWNDDPDGDGYNGYVESFAEASKTLLGHFAGRIRRWEIWNEPSCWSNPNWATDPKNAGCSYLLPRVFAKMLAEVYVRNETLLASQGIALVSGGLFAHDIGGSVTTGTDYLGELYSQSVWDWLEGNKGRRYPWALLGYHIYVEQGQQTDGATVGACLDAVRALAKQNADPARFLLTEIGWTTQGVSEAVQAANLTATYEKLASRKDLDQVFWFSFRDAPAAGLYFGIQRADGTDKQSAVALAAIASGCDPDPIPDGGADAASDASDIDDASDSAAQPDALPADGAAPLDGAGGSSPGKDGGAEADRGDLGTGPGQDATADGAPPVSLFEKSPQAEESGCACALPGGRYGAGVPFEASLLAALGASASSWRRRRAKRRSTALW